MPVQVALLRGVNVGGHKVAMAELRGLFTGLGCRDVATYIQSGNVVFTKDDSDLARLAAAIEERIVSTFGFPAPVVLRSASQLAAVAVANPFVDRGVDTKLVSVGFLAATPTAERVRSLLADRLGDPAATGDDEFSVSTQEVYLYHPNGYGRSKLTNSFFDRRLGTMMTVRNWRTVMTLLDMASGGIGAGS
jgi:uncharacterized protein (DUF1697 family)